MAGLPGLVEYYTDDESMATGAEGAAFPTKGDQGDGAEVSSQMASAIPVAEHDTQHTRLEPISEELQTQETVQDPMELQLPPDIAQPLTEICSADIQGRISHYLNIQQTKGRFINVELRSTRGYRNPDFLSHTVDHFKLDPIGTCYPKEIFDPHNLPKEDFHDALLAEWNSLREKKQQQQQQSQRIDFARGGTEQARTGSAGLQSKAQLTAQAKAQAVIAAAQHKGSHGKWDAGPGR